MPAVATVQFEEERCPKCTRLLFKRNGDLGEAQIQIKCTCRDLVLVTGKSTGTKKELPRERRGEVTER